MANYPVSLDTITNPTSGNTLDNPSHSLQHSDANDILEALEQKVGIGSSVAGSATAGHALVASTGGTTSWTTIGTAGISSGSATSGQILTANGSGGVSFSTPTTPGMVLLYTTDFSGASSYSYGSDAVPYFTSTYSNYRIDLYNLIGSSSTRTISFRLRANTTDLTSANYHYETFSANQTTLTGASSVNQTSWNVGSLTSAANEPSSIILEIQNPQVAKGKNMLSSNSFWQNGVGNQVRILYGTLTNTTQCNGFTFFSDANISGTMSIYGYNK